MKYRHFPILVSVILKDKLVLEGGYGFSEFFVSFWWPTLLLFNPISSSFLWIAAIYKEQVVCVGSVHFAWLGCCALQICFR